MCGIAGIVSSKETALSRLEGMTASVAHRGPDDVGWVNAEGVFLGHRRLTIIDLSANGHQPMTNEDGSVWIAYNGEVYQTDSTRMWLEGRGHRFRSRSDTEVILHLYEEKGTRLFEDLNGMFAFAIHDRRARRLLLARDRLGIKPLYYTFLDGEFLFGSEIKTILAGLPHRPALRAEVIGQYLLQGYASAPDTIFEGIYLLPQGHYLDIALDELQQGQMPEPVEYWDAPFTGDDLRPVDEIEQELDALLTDAVRMRMVADVPLGAFLSGGIDSSSVVALMANATSAPVKTFTVDLPGTVQSEHAKALAVVERYKTEHQVISCTASGADDYWPLLNHFDAPFNCVSLLNAWLVSRAARQYVTVALSGDGGDELFGGYARYERLSQATAEFAGQSVLRFAGNLMPHNLRGRARLLEYAKDDFTRVFTARHPIAIEVAESLVGVSLQSWVERMRAIYERYPADRLTRAMYFDLKTYLADQVLAKVDSASMKVSLEVRVPFLDYRVVELAGRIPATLKLRDGSSKWILKRLAQGWLPEELLQQKKVGFEPPLARWFFDSEMPNRLSELAQPDARYRSLIEGRPIDRWIADLRGLTKTQVPQRAALWSIYQFERWLRMQESSAEPPTGTLIAS